MKLLRILYQDDYLVAVQKPAGMHVHPPEDHRHTISPDQNCMRILRNQLGCSVFPVHRLDRATSGVLLFALNSESASSLGQQFQDRLPQKTYVAVTRGHFTHPPLIERSLKNAGEARTRIEVIQRVECSWPNKRFLKSRYSLLFAHPLTGRMHQIRRHLSGSGHPILGDTTYGDGEHNRIFRERFNVSHLWLHALSLEICHPATQSPMRFHARFPSSWHQLFDTFGVCAWQDFSGESERGI